MKAMTQKLVLRHTEYADLQTYLLGYTITGARLSQLGVPSVMLLADDDPVIPVAGLRDMQASSALKIMRSEFGGHCGFIDNFRLDSWVNQFIVGELRTEL
jgi:predicted alpha/beta-fold hydrolase